jgi:transposase
LLKEAIFMEQHREQLGPDLYRSLCFNLEERLDRLLAWKITDPKNQKLAKRLLRYRSEWFTFLYHEDVEPTNNLAERQIRPFVLQRKISAGNRSQWGAALQAQIMSVFSTSVQRGVNFIDLVLRALAQPHLAHL